MGRLGEWPKTGSQRNKKSINCSTNLKLSVENNLANKVLPTSSTFYEFLFTILFNKLNPLRVVTFFLLKVLQITHFLRVWTLFRSLYQSGKKVGFFFLKKF